MLTNHRTDVAVPPPPVPQSITMLRWIFRRGLKAVTCEVAAVAGRYEVCVVPHWHVASATIESFTAPVPALGRHAEIARRLKDDGWIVDHVPVTDDGEDLQAA